MAPITECSPTVNNSVKIPLQDNFSLQFLTKSKHLSLYLEVPTSSNNQRTNFEEYREGKKQYLHDVVPEFCSQIRFSEYQDCRKQCCVQER